MHRAAPNRTSGEPSRHFTRIDRASQVQTKPCPRYHFLINNLEEELSRFATAARCPVRPRVPCQIPVSHLYWTKFSLT